MQNHQFELQSGESVRLGSYTVKLLGIEGDEVMLEIEGPDDGVVVELQEMLRNQVEHESAVLV